MPLLLCAASLQLISHRTACRRCLLPSASASACRIVSRSARSSEASRCRVGEERYSGGRCAWVMSDPIDWITAETQISNDFGDPVHIASIFYVYVCRKGLVKRRSTAFR
jgi:hypothetical protein